MKPFSAFLPDLLPLVPSCPEPVAELALKRATQRFCELSRAWRLDLDPVTLIADIDLYDLELPMATELVRIERAKLDGQPIRVAPVDEECSERDYIRCPDGRQIVVAPMPAGTRSLVITASLKPGNAAQSVEDFIEARHRELIARGAAGRLMQQPGKTYSDANRGLLEFTAFESECIRVREQARRGYGRVPTRVIPNFF